MGVSGELLTIYAALPYVQKTGLYSITLPNKYNFSFDYYSFLILAMVSYIPREWPCSAHTQTKTQGPDPNLEYIQCYVVVALGCIS